MAEKILSELITFWSNHRVGLHYITFRSVNSGQHTHLRAGCQNATVKGQRVREGGTLTAVNPISNHIIRALWWVMVPYVPLHSRLE